jgi:hypothetical protein
MVGVPHRALIWQRGRVRPFSFFFGRTIGRRWLQRRFERSKSLHALETGGGDGEGWKANSPQPIASAFSLTSLDELFSYEPNQDVRFQNM